MSRNNKKKSMRSSDLKSHRRTGKLLQPPLRTLPNLAQLPWLRDTFPNMIWLCALITLNGDKPGMILAGKVLDRVTVVLGGRPGGSHDDAVPMLTGELVAFERVPEERRAEVLVALKRDGLYEEAFPWILCRGLAKYQELPGRWIFEGWLGNEQIVAATEPEKLLRRVVEDSAHGQSSTATKAKTMILRAYLAAGKIRFAPGVADWAKILPRYPDEITEEERRRVEPSIRATFMALAHGPGDGESADGSAPLNWAVAFWRQNWVLYECEPQSPEPNFSRDADRAETTATINEARDAWIADVDRMTADFLEASRGVDPDLYIPDRHEVLTGIAYRLLRSIAILVKVPPLWTMEHGSPVLRALVEGRIVLKWLAMKDDAELYARFKNYGRGRLKLLKLHLEEYRDSLDRVPEGLNEHIEYLDWQVNRDIWEEFQDISIEGNFAGVDTRRMAEQVGMMQEYRLIFSPASASVHGEWASLEQYALSTCLNPLHRWHRVPDTNPMQQLGPATVEVALGMMEQIIGDYREVLGVSGPRNP
jgi:hypothetical protein